MRTPDLVRAGWPVGPVFEIEAGHPIAGAYFLHAAADGDHVTRGVRRNHEAGTARIRRQRLEIATIERYGTHVHQDLVWRELGDGCFDELPSKAALGLLEDDLARVCWQG